MEGSNINILGFSPKLNEVVLSTKLDTVFDELSGEIYGGLDKKGLGVTPKNVYGMGQVNTSLRTLAINGFVYVRDVQTYVHCLDADNPIASVQTREHMWDSHTCPIYEEHRGIFLGRDNDPEYQEGVWNAITTTSAKAHYTFKHIEDNMGDKFSRCSISDEICRTSDLFTVRSTRESSHTYTVCPSEFSDEYFNCDSCDHNFHNDYYCEDGYCEACYNENDESYGDEDSHLSCYSTKVDRLLGFFDVKGTKLPMDKLAKKQFFGVELELEVPNHNLCHLSDFIETLPDRQLGVCCSDASMDYGLEIKVPPCEGSYIKTHMSKIMKLVKEQGDNLEAQSTCGMHVHVSRASLTELQIGKIASLIYSPSNKRFMEYIAGREASSTYCRFDKDRKQMMHTTKAYNENGYHTNIQDDPDPLNKYRAKREQLSFTNQERYAALNLQKSGTIEFRLFASSTDHDTIMANLDFVRSLVAYTRAGGPSNWEQASGHRHFLTWLRSNPKGFKELIHKLESDGWLAKKKGKKVPPPSDLYKKHKSASLKSQRKLERKILLSTLNA
jgi:hypothetical protein